MEKKNNIKSKKKAIILSVVAVLNFNLILNFVIGVTLGRKFPQFQGDLKINKWYAIDIDEAVSSDGSGWQRYIKKGLENKIMVLFFGGGLSVDEYTAARPLENNDGFYNAKMSTSQNVMARYIAQYGIGNTEKNNPFKDWSVIAISYDNGDFHAGQGEFEYTALDGSKKILYHHGYKNYQLMMNEALKYVGKTPEQVLITGASAGGFGAAILADDVTTYFPETNNFTVYVDSSLLLYDNWHSVMTDVWKSPTKLSDFVSSDNITLDSLIHFKNKHEDAHIIFGSSVRDYNLSMMQTYFDYETMNKYPSQVEGDQYQKNLKAMVDDMKREIPDCGIYVWDNIAQNEGHLSIHTAQGTKIFFEDRVEGVPLVQWVIDAVNGNVKRYGLELLEKKY